MLAKVRRDKVIRIVASFHIIEAACIGMVYIIPDHIICSYSYWCEDNLLCNIQG